MTLIVEVVCRLERVRVFVWAVVNQQQDVLETKQRANVVHDTLTAVSLIRSNSTSNCYKEEEGLIHFSRVVCMPGRKGWVQWGRCPLPPIISEQKN